MGQHKLLLTCSVSVTMSEGSGTDLIVFLTLLLSTVLRRTIVVMMC